MPVPKTAMDHNNASVAGEYEVRLSRKVRVAILGRGYVIALFNRVEIVPDLERTRDVELEPLTRLTRAELDGAEEQAERFAAFLGLPLEMETRKRKASPRRSTKSARRSIGHMSSKQRISPSIGEGFLPGPPGAPPLTT